MEKLLTEVCDIQYGYPFDSTKFSETEGTPLIRIRDVVRGYSETFTTEEYNPDYLVHQGDLLIGMDGEFNIAKWGNTPAVLNQRVCRLIPKSSIDKGYLYYCMPFILKKIEAKTPFVTVKHLSAKELNKAKIPLPSLDEQRRIAAVLDKVSDLIAKRKQQLDKLDELVKARFVEMFGEPISNPHGWKQVALRELTTKIGSGATPRGGRKSYQREGITFIRSMNVYDGQFEYKDLAHITDQQAKQLENVTVMKGDVLINITGASVARSCVVPNNVLPARVNQHVAIVRCIPGKLDPIFTNNLFINDSFKRLLLNIGEYGGATRQAITKQQLETLTIIVPPVELQQKFSSFAGQIGNIKLTIEESLCKMEETRKVLMQRYFER